MNFVFPIVVFAIVLGVIGIASFTNFELDNYHYDRLKWVVIRWTYLVTFIGVIIKTFEISYGIETVTIVAGFGAMLAGLMNISHSNYYGEIEDDDDELYDPELIDVNEEGDE